ncbi:DUF6941 family protein [Rhizobium miluonense]|nr:hypothetical protein [Rhizobium miluonense]
MPNTKVYDPHGFVVFCDDVREESSGKSTYIGVYNHVLSVSKFPAQLPTFAMVVHLFCNLDERPRTLEFQMALPGDDVDKPKIKFQLEPEKLAAQHPDMGDGDEIFAPREHYTVNLRANPFPLFRSGRLRVTAIWDGKRIALGSLPVILEDKDDEIIEAEII